MVETFVWDVFLSHSSKDKAVVRPLVEQLKNDGLSVWFDEWSTRKFPGILLQTGRGAVQGG